jgi:hypothetical protein
MANHSARSLSLPQFDSATAILGQVARAFRRQTARFASWRRSNLATSNTPPLRNQSPSMSFKSTERAQADDITRDQLHVYVVGYEELTGERADLVEVLNLDEKADSKREVVNDDLLTGIRTKIRAAGDDLRA